MLIIQEPKGKRVHDITGRGRFCRIWQHEQINLGPACVEVIGKTGLRYIAIVKSVRKLGLEVGLRW